MICFITERKAKLFRRSGCTDMWKKILLLVGIILCIYPYVGNRISTWKQQKILASDKEELVGELIIPKIEVQLPIYPCDDEKVLELGVGWVANSDAPGSGIGTHSLLAGHRGLPHATLLKHLDEMEKGDEFYILQEEKTLCYRVCNIQIILPDDTESLKRMDGKELVSLITCTPYGIHTHRLIVTGERIK